LAPQIEEHLAKIEADPQSRDVPHWVKEINSWIGQMERIIPDTGDKTAEQWRARIDEWKARLGS
jgi:hypothetical protein